ncbi:response regulator [Sediminivirga luteola]|uniref:DNA-binding response regulator n=1 Tax=Sediminivirga luteola TaxID=1774748 RepID=A0A8J2XKK5_9MICO|nr:response regulator transcription factor [Sediminivirga luteola]MCI2265820.1 response regulator transcription factor [Sediminivirga luteola]GGA14385.1 DNA-binding response regulator [Sediminivirga luteola]
MNDSPGTPPMSQPPGQPQVRVLVVDDQTLVRQGIRTLLELGGIAVVGEAADGAEALAALEHHAAGPAQNPPSPGAGPPDVVLLDLRMPRYDGLWLLERLAERGTGGADLPVLVLTTFDDDELVLQALRHGARGYLLKDVTVEQLSRAVRTLAAGGTLIAPSITDRLLRALRQGPQPAGIEGTRTQALTEREREVLRLVAEGYSNRQIASLVHLAEGTVKNHISAVLVKLGARDRTNAVLHALREGLLD